MKTLLFFTISVFLLSSCSAPQIEEGFLNEEYYANFNSTRETPQSNGSNKLQSKVDSLILELNRVQFRLLQMQLDYLTLSNNLMNLQLHASELKLMQHLKEHELMAAKETGNESIAPTQADGNTHAAGQQKHSNEAKNDVAAAEDQTPSGKALAGIDKRRILVFDNIYEEGILLFNNKKYSEAREKFDTLLKLDARDEDLVDNSYYWLGECYFALGNFTTAIEQFKKVLEIKESNKNQDALVMLAQTYEKLNWKELARDTYSKFIELYPNNKNAPFAKTRLKGLLKNDTEKKQE